ncbi:MAG: hypothetical protein SWX82_03955 [Cyanobacteriota bacterium]|nr:hypothetical protein [Cyanobacteriota bacterium]
MPFAPTKYGAWCVNPDEIQKIVLLPYSPTPLLPYSLLSRSPTPGA